MYCTYLQYTNPVKYILIQIGKTGKLKQTKFLNLKIYIMPNKISPTLYTNTQFKVINLLPLLHNLVPVLISYERFIDTVDHILATEDALTGYDVVDLEPQDFSEREAIGRDSWQLDVGEDG